MTESVAAEGIFQRLIELSIPDNALTAGRGDYDVYEASGYRWICFPPGAVQCAMDLADPPQLVLPNQRAMLLAGLIPNNPAKVLDLGTGGGGFVRALSVLSPTPQLSCVELDPVMLSLAREYFQLPLTQPVHVQDASDFIANDNEAYDLVFCDLFSGLDAPAHLTGGELMALLPRRLTDTGAAAINTLPKREADVRRLLEAARSQFPGVAVLTMEFLGNVVLLLGKEPLPDVEDWRAKLRSSLWRGDPVLESALGRLVYA